MNLLNRFVSILVIILVWFVIVLVVAAPEASLGWAQQGLGWASANAAAVSARQPGWLYLLIRAGVNTNVFFRMRREQLEQAPAPAEDEESFGDNNE